MHPIPLTDLTIVMAPPSDIAFSLSEEFKSGLDILRRRTMLSTAFLP